MLVYEILLLVACLVIGYLFGSIPFGVIVSKRFFKYDLRDYGSHNSGGTNAARVMGKKYGITVIILDMIKFAVPYLAVWLIMTLTPLKNYCLFDMPELYYYGTAFTIVVGHCFPIFAHFKGGKAVACTASTIWCTSYVGLGFAAIGFFGTLGGSKMVSLSSLIGSVVATIVSYFVFVPAISPYITYPGMAHNWVYPLLMTLDTLVIFIRHRANIKRLANGEESKIGQKKEEKQEITEQVEN